MTNKFENITDGSSYSDTTCETWDWDLGPPGSGAVKIVIMIAEKSERICIYQKCHLYQDVDQAGDNLCRK